MITVFSNNKQIPTNKVDYSDEAITYKLDQLQPNAKYISINVDPSTKVNIVREELTMIMECIYELTLKGYFEHNVPMTLNLPYLPYARADRIFEKGNPHGLNSFLFFLSDLDFDEIYICDIHNIQPVTDFIHDLPIKEKTQLLCFKDSLSFDTVKDWDVVVAPDKGAVEKAKTIAEYLNVPCVFANKVRDVSTGKLTEMNLPDYDFTGKKVLIPDDIFDYGGTLKWLGGLLKQAGAKKVELYVTHLIAPKGLKHLTGIIDKVYCHHTVAGYINKQTVTDFNLGQ